MKINVWHTIEQRTVDAAIGIQDSKHAYVPKADILSTWCKLICVEQIASLMNIYCN